MVNHFSFLSSSSSSTSPCIRFDSMAQQINRKIKYENEKVPMKDILFAKTFSFVSCRLSPQLLIAYKLFPKSPEKNQIKLIQLNWQLQRHAINKITNNRDGNDTIRKIFSIKFQTIAEEFNEFEKSINVDCRFLGKNERFEKCTNWQVNCTRTFGKKSSTMKYQMNRSSVPLKAINWLERCTKWNATDKHF